MLESETAVEAPYEEAIEARHLLRKMMTTAAKLRVPLKVDFQDYPDLPAKLVVYLCLWAARMEPNFFCNVLTWQVETSVMKKSLP
jgi:hypothetical protein